MSTSWTLFERAALKAGLEEALNEDYPTFNFSTIVRGTNTYVLKMDLPSRTGKPSKLIAKWFLDEPKSGECEPLYESFHRLDVLYNAEVRNLHSIRQVVDQSNVLLPVVYGTSQRQRLIAMEFIGSTPRKNKFLQQAIQARYTGESTKIPDRLVSRFIHAVDTLSLLVGACNAKASEFKQKFDYSRDAAYRDERWIDVSEERLTRLYRRHHPRKELPHEMRAKLQKLHQHSAKFREPEGLYHGDFNLLHLLGEKVIDFESFGQHGCGKDFATLLVLADLKDSSGILRSSSFQYMTDRYLVGTNYAQMAESLKEAKKRIQAINSLTPNEVHQEALQILDQEQYANFVASVFYQAFHKHISVAAAYDRMEQWGIQGVRNEKPDYHKLIGGLSIGMDKILRVVLEENKILERTSDKKERREYFKEYKALLQELKLIG